MVAKALGETEETEYKTGLSEIAKVSQGLRKINLLIARLADDLRSHLLDYSD